MAEQKGLPIAGAGSNWFGYPRNSTYVGGEGKDQRQQQKEQEFCLHLREKEDFDFHKIFFCFT